VFCKHLYNLTEYKWKC